jgi:hypothetical protein
MLEWFGFERDFDSAEAAAVAEPPLDRAMRPAR